MGAMMGSVLQAPLAAIITIIELTLTPHIILPVMLMIITSSLIASYYFKQRSVFLTILRLQGLDYQAEPAMLALRRVSVSAVMERNIVRTPQVLSWQDCQDLLQNSPKWIVIEDEEKPVAILPAAEFARYLEETEASPDFTAETLTINLTMIPAHRLDVASLHLQATLEEALQRFNAEGVEALYVERTTAPMIRPIIGVITRENINSFYQYTPK